MSLMSHQLPVASAARIRELDVLRGVALFGILLANVRQMFLPWEVADRPVAIGVSVWLAWIDWGLFHALIDLKFLTLFSVMFGIGFALQSERLSLRGEGFTRVYLRRVLILAAFGVAHGLLLYSAEVLLCYALAGLVLLAVRRLSTGALLRVGIVLLGTVLLWGFQIDALGKVYPLLTLVTFAGLVFVMTVLWRAGWAVALTLSVVLITAAATMMTIRYSAGGGTSHAAAQYAEVQRIVAAMSSSDPTRWPAELLVRRQGDLGALLWHHVTQYRNLLAYLLVFLFWRTLGLFMIGAAIYRSGLLARLLPSDWKRVAWYGWGFGLPLSVLATLLQGGAMTGFVEFRLSSLLHTLSALPMAAGILGLVFALTRSQIASRPVALLESTGRMALSNYIGQSVVMATLAESWGVGLYARLGGPPLTLLAVGAFFALALLSHLWLSRFRLGPLEWIWRCGTYWQWLPNRRQ